MNDKQIPSLELQSKEFISKEIASQSYSSHAIMIIFPEKPKGTASGIENIAREIQEGIIKMITFNTTGNYLNRFAKQESYLFSL